jgi:hypothetical protein
MGIIRLRFLGQFVKEEKILKVVGKKGFDAFSEF